MKIKISGNMSAPNYKSKTQLMGEIIDTVYEDFEKPEADGIFLRMTDHLLRAREEWRPAEEIENLERGLAASNLTIAQGMGSTGPAAFPGRFEDITAAIAFCRSFFPWYNTEHRHAGIAMLTPDDVHHHRAPDVLAQRGRTLQAAWALHPERFVHGTPKPAPLPEAVWINPPATSTTGETSQ